MPPRIPQIPQIRPGPRWTCRKCLLRITEIGPTRRSQTTDAATSSPPGENCSVSHQHLPQAPKANVSVRAIREASEYHTQNCINRNYSALSDYPQRITTLHDELVAMQKSLRAERERQNTLGFHLRRAEKEEKKALINERKALKEKISEVEQKESDVDREMKSLAAALPNVTHPLTPVGHEPKLLAYLNPELAPKDEHHPDKVKNHIQIGAELKLLDFSDAGAVSGWGWYYLLNEAVLLEQALVNYALSLARAQGWMLVSPPTVVNAHIAAACGFRPRDQHGEQQSYVINDGRHVMAGTAEIPLAGMHANKTFDINQLPLKVVGMSRAYRAEAGAAGVDAKGLYRVHEFTKVELFAWAAPGSTDDASHHETEGDFASSASTSPAFQTSSTKPQNAENVFDEMLALQKSFLTSLGLYSRVMEMPSWDLGASASRKIDIETYIPSRAAKDPWGEVTSLSNCTDYQTRRLNTRFKGMDGKLGYPYTLNGTACAIPRVLIAVLENWWSEEKGSVVVPPVLRPFMGGMEFIGKGKVDKIAFEV